MGNYGKYHFDLKKESQNSFGWIDAGSTWGCTDLQTMSKEMTNLFSILDDIKESLKLIENRNEITVQKITSVLNNSLSKQYNLFDIRRIYNKQDIAIFEYYNLINLEKQDAIKIDQTKLTAMVLPSLKTKNNFHLDGYEITIEEASNELSPLFWFNSEGLRIIIYVNNAHKKYQLGKEEILFQFIAAIVRSSFSFSDNSGEVFLNRTKNYLELL